MSDNRGGMIGQKGPRQIVSPKNNLLELFGAFVYGLAFALVWMMLAWGCVGFAWLGDPNSGFIYWITQHSRWWWIVALLGFPVALLGLLYIIWTGMHDPFYEPMNDILPRALPLTPAVRIIYGAWNAIKALTFLGKKPDPRPSVHLDIDYEDDGIRAGKKK